MEPGSPQNEEARAVAYELSKIAETLVLGDALGWVRERYGAYEIVSHWRQGELHHDIVLRIQEAPREPASGGALAGYVLLLSLNCNGGLKEVSCFEAPFERDALWQQRCPEAAPEAASGLPRQLGLARTIHWVDPCRFLRPQ